MEKAKNETNTHRSIRDNPLFNEIVLGMKAEPNDIAKYKTTKRQNYLKEVRYSLPKPEDEKIPTEWSEVPLLLTPKLICRLMGVTTTTVSKWLLSGELKGKMRANKWYIDKADFKAFIKPYAVENPEENWTCEKCGNTTNEIPDNSHLHGGAYCEVCGGKYVKSDLQSLTKRKDFKNE